MFESLRPGVYARYELSGTGAPEGTRAAALILRREGREPGCRLLRRLSDGAALAEGDAMAGNCLRLLFEGGAGAVHLVFYGDGGEAPPALSAHVSAIVCDESVSKAAMTGYLGDCAARRSCLILTARDKPGEAAAAAEALAHERILVCGPAVRLPDGSESGLYAACCLAGAILAADSPTARFAGMDFPALAGAVPLPEEEIQALLGAGVCVFEEAGGVRLIRAFTTSPDRSLRSLSTALITDRVMARIRLRLRDLLREGATNPASIRDQVTAELMALEEDGLLTGFDPPVCSPKENDPACCVVELSVSVAHLVSRIHITARIRA